MYAAGAWMHRSGDLQDVMYAAGAWMHRSGDLQDVMYAAGAWICTWKYLCRGRTGVRSDRTGAAIYRM